MNKKITFNQTYIVIAIVMLFFVRCSSTRHAYYTPKPSIYQIEENISFVNGFPQEAQPWVVFSDRCNNRIFQTVKENLFTEYNDATFLAPFIILEKANGMYKVAEYKEGIINDGKVPSAKHLKVLGWIPEERLLLWSNSLKNNTTGFSTKAALVVNNEDVIKQSEKYLENDSVLLFLDPELVVKSEQKLPLGTLVYIYKYSKDADRVLIGKEQGSVVTGIPQNVYGWVSKNMLALWGDRPAVKLKNEDIGIVEANDLLNKFAITPSEMQEREGIQAVYPQKTNGFTNVFTNIFDYSNNKIYNVLGEPVQFNKYQKILADNRNLNVVFVLDASRNNRLYFPLVKSLLQELQLNFKNPNYFSTVKFGGVIYKQNTCGVGGLHSNLSSDYRDVTTFFERKMEQLNCPDNSIIQPVNTGLSAATRMLSPVPDETNIIILIGTTANQNIQSQTLVNALSRTNSRLVVFQTQSRSSDAYNDFVLLGQKLVLNSAANIAERKKQKIINQVDLLLDVDYNLGTGENGVYFLNFPSQSMTQGYVLFPKKGETMSAGLLKNAIDSILAQVTADNIQIDNSLTKYFRSEIGVSNTHLAKPYFNRFALNEKLIPTRIASSLLNHKTSFLVEGKFTGLADSIIQKNLSHGVLLNEQEYEQLRAFYTYVYKAVFSLPKTTKYATIKAFLKVAATNMSSLKKYDSGKLEKMPMKEIMSLTTGFSLNGYTYMDMTPKNWMKNRDLKNERILSFFEEFGKIAIRMGNMKGDNAIRITHNGQTFYWLDDSFVPKINN